MTVPVSARGSGNAFDIGSRPLISWSLPNRPVVRAQIAPAGTLYRFGRTDVPSLLTAQANLAATDALLVDRQVDVFRALGGGWQA